MEIGTENRVVRIEPIVDPIPSRAGHAGVERDPRINDVEHSVQALETGARQARRSVQRPAALEDAPR